MLLLRFDPRAGSSASPRPPRCHQSTFPTPVHETGASLRSSGRHLVLAQANARPNPSALSAAAVAAGEICTNEFAPRHERTQPSANETNPTAALPRPAPRNSALPNPVAAASGPAEARTFEPEHRRRAGIKSNPGTPPIAAMAHGRMNPSRPSQRGTPVAWPACKLSGGGACASTGSREPSYLPTVSESRLWVGSPLSREE